MSSGKKSMRSVEKELVHYILRLDFQSALWTNENMVNVSTGKRRAEFSIHSSGKNEMLYTCRLAEKSLGFQSSLRVKRKCCRDKRAGSSICSSEIKKLERSRSRSHSRVD